MKFRLYRQYGALNSKPIFDAFEQGIKQLGHTSVEQDEDVAVIWSVLWNGRMAGNQNIYNHCIANNIPVMIIEVGNLLRNQSWRISLNNINRLGTFADTDIDESRPGKFNLALLPTNTTRSASILIASQHDKSLQWQGMPSMSKWVEDTVAVVQKYTDRPIVVRPHPRCKVTVNIPNVTVQLPKHVNGSYDNFDIAYNYHCVINHNSGPTIHAAINGTPVICDSSSLAYLVSDKMENIESPFLPDRELWFLKLTNTEWFIDEIAAGIPQNRLINLL
jgi:hypothetical protein